MAQGQDHVGMSLNFVHDFARFYISSSDGTVAVTAQHRTATGFYHERVALWGRGKAPVRILRGW